MRGLDRLLESTYASSANNTTPSGKHNPAFPHGPSEGNTPRVAGCPPADPAPSGQTGGAGLSLTDELRALGTVPVPTALLARTWLAVLGELSTAHPAEADSPVTPFGGITGRSSLLLPDGPRLRAGGCRGGA